MKYFGVFAGLIALLWASQMAAQIQRPKYESRMHHLFAAHRDVDNLEQRYKDLACGLVVIQSGNSVRTGFYISSDGDVVTASHVLGTKTFQPEGKHTRITIYSPPVLMLRDAKGEFQVLSSQLEQNADDWAYDIALLKTGRSTNCWLKIGDDKLAHPGHHVITMGFPGLAFGSLSIYSGFVVAKLKSGLITGTTVQGQAFTASNDFIRVQMPISPGISGAPIIDDENRAIAVVTSAGASTHDLDVLAQLSRMGAIPESAPNTVSIPSAVAQFVRVFRDFYSPGYGDAVPLSYLAKKVQQAVPKSSSPVH